MRVEIDGGGYGQACDALYSGNQDVCSTLLDLAGVVDGGGAMAGGDTCGQAWAEQYDPAAVRALDAGEDLAEAFAKLANLTNASLVNHQAADGGALLSGGPYVSMDTGDHDPNHWTSSVGLGAPPSAYGGTGDEPGWWHWIAGHLGGWFWPDADTGRLRSVGTGWQKASDALTANAGWAESAATDLGIERSPEISVAISAVTTLKRHCTDLASAYHDLGEACIDYAQEVDDKHDEIEHELASFVAWTIGIEAGGALLGAVTLGIGEGAAQIAEGAKVAQASSKVIGILTRLLEIARTAAAAVRLVLTRIGEIVTDLGRFLTGTREVAAVERAGAEAAEAMASRGAWTKVSESMSERAAAYQEQITGRAGDAYVVDGVKFDGYLDGALIDAKGPGYARFVKDGEFRAWWRGSDSLVSQAQRQLEAANGAPVVWHVAEDGAAHAIEDLLADNGITTIKIVITPAK